MARVMVTRERVAPAGASVPRPAFLVLPVMLMFVAAAAATAAAAAAAAAADEQVAVEGSSAKYPISIESKVGDKAARLALTGAGLRKKGVFKVYAIGSYVEQGITIANATELAQKDCAKQLHLVMERGVSGKAMAEAFVEGIELNYPAERFADQNGLLLAFMKQHSLKTGDQIRLTHVPGVGFHCALPGDKQVLIKDVPFAVAIWEIYLGKKNIGEGVKAGLTSRLPAQEKK